MDGDTFIELEKNIFDDVDFVLDNFGKQFVFLEFWGYRPY